jgi:hypothetical protein
LVLNVRSASWIGIRALGYDHSALPDCSWRAVLLGIWGGWQVPDRLAPPRTPDPASSGDREGDSGRAVVAGGVVVAPAFAALASFIPAMLAVTQDPADTLREA